jgi:hypothetical protein
MKTITIVELENHISKWFGSDWGNQSPSQILAMTIGLLATVNVEVISEEYHGDESDNFLQ